MLKLPTVKLIVLFHHFCVSDIDKIRKKVEVVRKIHFSESYNELKSTVEV